MSITELKHKVSRSDDHSKIPDIKALRAIGQRTESETSRSTGDNSDNSRSSVSKTLINFWLDALLMVAFVALSIVSVIVQFVFPPGVNSKGWMLWGMSLNHWSGIQFGILAFLGFGIVVHVMLHWTWVCSVVAKKLLRQKEIPDGGLQTVYGVGLLIGLLLLGAVIVGVATMTIQMPPQ